MRLGRTCQPIGAWLVMRQKFTGELQLLDTGSGQFSGESAHGRVDCDGPTIQRWIRIHNIWWQPISVMVRQFTGELSDTGSGQFSGESAQAWWLWWSDNSAVNSNSYVVTTNFSDGPTIHRWIVGHRLRTIQRWICPSVVTNSAMNFYAPNCSDEQRNIGAHWSALSLIYLSNWAEMRFKTTLAVPNFHLNTHVLCARGWLWIPISVWFQNNSAVN